MARKIKRILCLGNHQIDTDQRARIWAQRFGIEFQGLYNHSVVLPGCYHSDLGTTGIDTLHDLVDSFDLIIKLDQSPQTFEHAETHQQLHCLAHWWRHHRATMIEGFSDPTTWITAWSWPDRITIQAEDDDQILDHVQQLANSRLVLQLGATDNIRRFRARLQEIDRHCRANRNQWVVFRAGAHEDLHFEATMALLDYPQFVFLRPDTFVGNVQEKLQHQIYHHWTRLYL